jgi:hypothetical protein
MAKGKSQKAKVKKPVLSVLPFALCILTFDLLCWPERTSQMAKGKGQKANVKKPVSILPSSPARGLSILPFALCILTCSVGLKEQFKWLNT